MVEAGERDNGGTIDAACDQPVQFTGALAVKCWVPADISAAEPPGTFCPSIWIELT